MQADKAALPSETLSVLVELGAAERAAGNYRSALVRYDAAQAPCQSVLNAQGAACVYNQFHRSRLLLLLGLDERAMDAVPSLVAPTAPGAAETSWDTRKVVQAYEVLAQNRRLVQYPDVVARVGTAADPTANGGTHWHGALAARVAQARDALRRGQLHEAMRQSAQAQSLISAHGARADRFVLHAQVVHAFSLHALGSDRAALELLDRVDAAQVQGLTANHPDMQLLSITRVRPLWALQRQQEALTLIDHALPILREALGEQAPMLARIRALRNALATAPPGSLPDMGAIEIFM
jgi:tetratricopeptide (TPR) repeat protein